MQNIGSDQLLFAIPKKGRLHEKILKVLAGAGLEFLRQPRLDLAVCIELPITMVFLPAHDIAQYVAEGNCDMGITGQDIISETENMDLIKEILPMGFGKCKLCVQAPVGKYKNAKEVVGGRIVTSFPNLAKSFFDSLDTSTETKIREVSGSVEVACSLGLADAVVDLVETGTTMKAAGLEIIDVIMNTETVLITKPTLPEDKQKMVDRIFKRMQGYLIATKTCMISYNIPKAFLEKAQEITPGKESPTVMALQDPKWVAVQALVQSKGVSSIMDALVDIGAKSILITEVSNCRFPSDHDCDFYHESKRQKI